MVRSVGYVAIPIDILNTLFFMCARKQTARISSLPLFEPAGNQADDCEDDSEDTEEYKFGGCC